MKRATHMMYAFRVMPEKSTPGGAAHTSSTVSGQDDGGESGSGERLAKLLELSQCENVAVVVTRWYGGVHLGSTRWKRISEVAKEALARGEFSGGGKLRKQAMKGQGKAK
ncbi:hypothetical protein BDV98DRAFT_557130 [Pterulicium gracile]|uniref:Impact N-terminal domain-containing protein n=1 Tax=Pterulicium gracile TaxID=1884261 RepID=A0A5C3QYC9_9AGAR|nr:hypothetical protein BDV98DRAFT_557130 [Pterula gracilis]